MVSPVDFNASSRRPRVASESAAACESGAAPKIGRNSSRERIVTFTVGGTPSTQSPPGQAALASPPMSGPSPHGATLVVRFT
jgi:hypothetical protein